MWTRSRACTRETGRCSVASTSSTSRRASFAIGAIVTTPATRVERAHVLRLGGGDAEPAALTDRERDGAGVATEHRALGVVDLARAQVHPVPIEEAPQIASSEEADVLALGRRGRRETGSARLGADVVLVCVRERELQHAEQLRRHPREHRRLVLREIGAACDERTAGVRHEARVVAGREPRGAERAAPSRPAARCGSRRCTSCTGSGVRPAW